MVVTTALVGVAVLVVGLVAAYRSVRIVDEGELEAILVFGEMKGVLRPGLNVVPPFVSKTYPVDPRTMTMDKDGEQVDVPAAFESEVREAADSG
jgi:regulator of protease activity HflC (stomatin/prohibitin superfamily)